MTWTMTRDNIIERALEISGLKTIGLAAQLPQVLIAADELNGIIEGLNSTMTTPLQMLWTTQTLTTSSLVLNATISYKCILSHTSSADSEPGVGSLSDMYWLVTTGAVNAWVTSTAYQSIGDFSAPTNLEDILVMHIQSGSTSYPPMKVISDNQWFGGINSTELISYYRQGIGGTSSRSDTGLPSNYYFDRKGTIYLIAQPDVATYLVHYLGIYNLETPTEASEEPLYTKAFYHYLKLALGAAMANYNQALPTPKQQNLERQANIAFSILKKRDFHKSQ